LKIRNKKLLKILAGILVVLFLLGSIGYFFAYVPSDWFM
jgi:flagellar basal body-associated protein FliL